MLNSLYYDNFYSDFSFLENIFFIFLILFYLSFIIEQNLNKIKLLHLILFLFLFFLVYLHDEWTVAFDIHFAWSLDWDWEWYVFGYDYYELPELHLDSYMEFMFLCFTFILSIIMFGFCNNILMKSNKDFEFSWLIYLFLMASLFLFISYSFVEVFIALECLGLCSYILISIERTKKLSATAGIQYLILSSIPSCLFILGNIYIYQNYGTFLRDNIEILLESSTKNFFNINFYDNVNLSLNKSLNQILTWLDSWRLGALQRYKYVDVHMEFRLKNCYDNRIRIWYKRAKVMPYYDMFDSVAHRNFAWKSFIRDHNNILKTHLAWIDRELPTRKISFESHPWALKDRWKYRWDLPKLFSEWYYSGLWNDYMAVWIDSNTSSEKSIEYIPLYFYRYGLTHHTNWFNLYSFMAPQKLHQIPCMMRYYDYYSHYRYTFKYFIESISDTRYAHEAPFITDFPWLETRGYKSPEVCYLLVATHKRIGINHEILFSLNNDIPYLNKLIYKNFFINKYVFLSMNLALLLIIINLSFKITAAPFHIWAPIIYNNGSLASVLFLNIFSKFVLIIFFLTIFTSTFYSLKADWSAILFILSFLSILFGMLNAFNEKLIKKFFVFSSMTDVGFILLGISFYNIQMHKYIVNYLFVYNFSSLIIWFILLYLKKYTKYLTNIRMILAGDIILNIIFSFNIFSLAGIPPFGGFFIKLDLLVFLIASSKFFISFIILLFTVINFFYYLRFIKMIYFDDTLDNKIYNKIDEYKFFIFALFINIICAFEIYMQNSFIFIIENIIQTNF